MRQAFRSSSKKIGEFSMVRSAAGWISHSRIGGGTRYDQTGALIACVCIQRGTRRLACERGEGGVRKKKKKALWAFALVRQLLWALNLAAHGANETQLFPRGRDRTRLQSAGSPGHVRMRAQKITSLCTGVCRASKSGSVFSFNAAVTTARRQHATLHNLFASASCRELVPCSGVSMMSGTKR